MVRLIGLFFLWMLTSHAEQATGRVNAIRVPGAGQVRKAQLGADGTIHLLLNGADGPQYVNSRDRGLTFSAPIQIVDRAAQKPGLEFDGEDLAIGKNGRILVAMSNNAWKLKLPEEQWGLYYATLLPGAKAFTRVRNLNLKPSEGLSLGCGQARPGDRLFPLGQALR